MTEKRKTGRSSLGMPIPGTMIGDASNVSVEMQRGAVASAPSPPAGASVQLVAPVPAKVNRVGNVALVKAVGHGNPPQLTKIDRWESPDQGCARIVRVTTSGTIDAPGTAFPSTSWGMMLLLEWGSESGASQRGWFPVPSDLEFSCTYLDVQAAVVPQPYAIPPQNFSTPADVLAATGQIVCSISEGHADPPPSMVLGEGTPGGAGYTKIVTGNAIVRNVIFSNYGAAGAWIGLLDIPLAVAVAGIGGSDTSVLSKIAPIWVPPMATIGRAFDEQGFFSNVYAYAVDSPAAPRTLDPTNGASVLVQVEGWQPNLDTLRRISGP